MGHNALSLSLPLCGCCACLGVAQGRRGSDAARAQLQAVVPGRGGAGLSRSGIGRTGKQNTTSTSRGAGTPRSHHRKGIVFRWDYPPPIAGPIISGATSPHHYPRTGVLDRMLVALSRGCLSCTRRGGRRAPSRQRPTPAKYREPVSGERCRPPDSEAGCVGRPGKICPATLGGGADGADSTRDLSTTRWWRGSLQRKCGRPRRSRRSRSRR